MSFDKERYNNLFDYPWSDDADYGAEHEDEEDDEGDFVDYFNRKYGWEEGSYPC